MTMEQETGATSELIAAMVLQHQVEQFLYNEASLLDTHDYERWVDLLAEDIHYFMPIRRTRLHRERAKEFTQPGEMAYFDDNKFLLIGRWKKFASNAAWSEDPASRTRHLITNVRITEDRGDELDVESYFHVYRTRLKYDTDTWVGRRQDVLRRHEGSFLIAKRTILLDQTILQSGNLSTLF